jgi:hypothetical protein
MYSNMNYIKNFIWYRVRITRTITGIFTVWIKGDIFSDWTLISTIGGSGTNPATDNTHTTSRYFVLDLDTNDCVADIEILPGIIQT